MQKVKIPKSSLDAALKESTENKQIASMHLEHLIKNAATFSEWEKTPIPDLCKVYSCCLGIEDHISNADFETDGNYLILSVVELELLVALLDEVKRVYKKIVPYGFSMLVN